jgi:hypothetical protein
MIVRMAEPEHSIRRSHRQVAATIHVLSLTRQHVRDA